MSESAIPDVSSSPVIYDAATEVEWAREELDHGQWIVLTWTTPKVEEEQFDPGCLGVFPSAVEAFAEVEKLKRIERLPPAQGTYAEVWGEPVYRVVPLYRSSED